MRGLTAVLLAAAALSVQAQPIFDAHLHYSHDAWDLVPVADAIAIMRKAGLRRALISSAGDEGQQRLYAAAPDLFLHAHSDVDAVERLFQQWPQARILWAHAGFDAPERVPAMLRRHGNLGCDLAFRTDHGSGGKVDPAWRAVFLEFPDRFMVGTDSYTPERWHYIPEHAEWSRRWLSDLPREVAERIAWKNGEALFSSFQRP
jgi:predicted TIM-barrel fold metal-dependent hydrolase